ncbi:MAG: SCO family protein [Flammeovirgaceae bacterium]|nr:SCO family protein [Flammeovirgaceae bacterium]
MTRYILLFLFIIGCNSSEVRSSRVEQLPYYNEATFTPNWFESDDSLPEDFHRIGEFSLLNQEGENISASDLDAKVTVVDFFFSTCTGICPKLTSNMTLVQDAFLEDEEVLLLSHSVTPSYDSVDVLKTYAKKKGVKLGKWHLLTGEREEIYDLGRNQYFAEEDLGLEKNPKDFLHTENIILLDGNRHIRGIYNGLNKTAINQLITDIKTLKNILN